MPMLVRRRFVVSGRVQGVGFRYYTERAARAEGISGYVENQDDGSVVVVAEGEAESMQRFEGRLRQGPPGAWIKSVSVNDEMPMGRADDFFIRS
jgi:acylphosphatase